MNEIMRRALAEAMRPLVELVYKIEAKVAGKPSFEWGTVTQTDPLRVRLDTHVSVLPDAPASLVTGLRQGDRVRVERQGTRAVIHGAGNAGDTGWISATMQNGWTSNSARPVQYRRVNGIVYLRGEADRSPMTNSAIFTLPAGFRIGNTGAFVGASVAADTVKIDVRSNGEVFLAGFVTGRTYAMLENIRFLAEG